MPISSFGLRHVNLRKRIHEKLEKYPNPDKFKRLLDKIIYYVAFLGPLITLPQVYKVFSSGDVSGISAVTFIGYTVVSCIWFVYGWAHKEKPIMISQGLFAILHGSIAVAALVY